MIDFRYHLVSLVAVFLALALGIVLGGGPLHETIGATLTDQVSALKGEERSLQAAVADRDDQLASRDAFLSAVGPRLVAGSLRGVSVVVVLLPGTPQAEATSLTRELQAAGATVTGTVAVQPTWTDPGQATFRRTLAAQAAPYLDPRPSADADTAEQLAAALAQGLVTRDPDPGSAPPAAGAVDGLELLHSAGLVSFDGAAPARANTAVVLGGPGTAAGASGATASSPRATSAGRTPSPSASTSAAGAGDGPDWGPLASALDSGGLGSVVAAPLSAAAAGGVLAGLRADVPDGVSTVDSVDTPAGVVATVLALAEQLVGGAGQYGSGAGGALPAPAELADGGRASPPRPLR